MRFCLHLEANPGKQWSTIVMYVEACVYIQTLIVTNAFPVLGLVFRHQNSAI